MKEQHALKCTWRIIIWWEKAWHPTRSHKKASQLFDTIKKIYLILHFIISSPVVKRHHMLLYILVIASRHNSSWHSQIKYSPLCWRYLLFFVSYKWFVSMFWILVDEREYISISFPKKKHTTHQHHPIHSTEHPLQCLRKQNKKDLTSLFLLSLSSVIFCQNAQVHSFYRSSEATSTKLKYAAQQSNVGTEESIIFVSCGKVWHYVARSLMNGVLKW